jgi:DnaK suppressor protein
MLNDVPVKEEAAMKSNAFLKAMRQQLVARREALRRSLGGDLRSLRAPQEEAVGDEVDAAIASEQAELNSQMASLESRELAQIAAALDKLRAGRYGRCDRCEKPITTLRLKALPYAEECIACARSHERLPSGSVGRGLINRIAAFTGDEFEANDEAYEEIA